MTTPMDFDRKFLMPEESGLVELPYPNKSPLQIAIERYGSALVEQPFVTKDDFENLANRLREFIVEGYDLPRRQDVDGRDRNHAGYWKPPLTWNENDELVADPTHAFHVSRTALNYWRLQGLGRGVFGAFLDDSEEMLAGLSKCAKSAVSDLEKDHPGLGDALFRLVTRDGNEEIGNPTLRMVIYDSDDDLSKLGLSKEQMQNIPYGKPHYDRSTLGLLAYGSSDDVFGIIPGSESTQVELSQLRYEQGKAHLFPGLGWTALYPDSSYRPLEHGIFRVTKVASDVVRKAVVLLVRPIKIDDSTPEIPQRLYTERQLEAFRLKALAVAS